MNEKELSVVTGAYGYSGKYITRRLLKGGNRVRTITGHLNRPNEFGDKVEAVPFHFDEPQKLVDNLKGAKTVFNTYWVRFNRGPTTYSKAVTDTKTLIQAAVEAGVERFVHISITKPSEDSAFPYFRGKAELERTLKESGLSYAIIRPTVLFGVEDILINNISWLLRRFPVFGILGKGDYKLQPVYVDDLAALTVKLARERENVIIDAVGPETYRYRELVEQVRKAVGSRSLLIDIPPLLGLVAGKILGSLIGDVLITKDEIGGLMAGLLVSDNPPTCPTLFSEWIKENAAGLGKQYASEVARHYR